MTTGKSIVEELKRFCRNNPDERKDLSFSHEVNGIRVEICVHDFDKLSFVLKAIVVENLKAQGASTLLLTKQAEFLKSKLTYLLENIEICEIDEISDKAQLRSTQPFAEDSSLSYYDIMLEKSQRLSLYRMVFDKNTKKTQKSQFHLTDEVLEKCLDDFSKALQLDKSI